MAKMNECELRNKLLEFSQKSMEWCSKQAEISTEATNSVLQMLLNDATRVSKMSKETLDALNSLKAQLSGTGKLLPDTKAKSVVGALKRLSAQHLEIGEFASPIIETLQFQDRIRQNMENLAKMTKTWISIREEEIPKGMSGPEVQKTFGELLLKTTTMQSERDIVRTQIPGLPAEQSAADVTFF